MTSESITSLHNPWLKTLRKAIVRGSLTDDGLAVAEGFHLLDEALRSPARLHAVVATAEALADIPALPPEVRTVTVPDNVFRHTASTETPQGILALIEPPPATLDKTLSGSAPLTVIIDGLQEPGNAGAILRAAEAFGATGAVFLKGSVNPYNPKALRASAGSIFRLPTVTGIDPAALIAALEQKGVRMFAALPAAGTDAAHTDLTRPTALIIGSEGRGVSASLAAQAAPIRIPTLAVESLNAAVAAGILLYEARRQRLNPGPEL